MISMQKQTRKLIFLTTAVIIALILYLTVNTRGNFAFAFLLRRQRILAFVLVGLNTSLATILFQTMTQNRILTPSIIGLDSLYVLLQTVIVFVFGTNHFLSIDVYANYFLSILLMVGSSLILYWLFFRKYPGRLYVLLMVGLIAGTFFSSLTTFLQVIIDPNEFESVFAQTVASFTSVNTTLIWISILICFPIFIYLFFQAPKLDVLHLGQRYATGLGIDVERYYLILFILISILIAVSTALVGPISFIGFIGANVSYRLFDTYKHTVLFIGGSLLSTFLIVFGQLLVEHLFKLQTTLGVIVQFVGGLYFLFILLQERNR